MICSGPGSPCVFSGSTRSAELYVPGPGQFVPTGSLEVARSNAQATLLLDGSVLVTGGNRYCGISCFLGSVAEAEVYHADP
jgi:hypothetical protein